MAVVGFHLILQCTLRTVPLTKSTKPIEDKRQSFRLKRIMYSGKQFTLIRKIIDIYHCLLQALNKNANWPGTLALVHSYIAQKAGELADGQTSLKFYVQQMTVKSRKGQVKIY